MASHTQLSRGAERQVNNSVRVEGPPVIDAHQNRPTRVKRGHLDIRVQRQRAVGCADPVGFEAFTGGSSAAPQFLTVPTGCTGLVELSRVVQCMASAPDAIVWANRHGAVVYGRPDLWA